MKLITKKVVFLGIVVIFMTIINVRAEAYYTNLNDVEMTQVEYENIVSMFSETRASILTQKEFDRLVNDFGELYNQIARLKSKFASESYSINLNPKGDFTITDSIVWGEAKSSVRTLIINGQKVKCNIA